jgi:hypothetical protein
MSIAEELEKEAKHLCDLLNRGNGELEAALPGILERLSAQTERVRGLENMEFLSADLLRDFQQAGDMYAG